MFVIIRRKVVYSRSNTHLGQIKHEPIEWRGGHVLLAAL